MQICLRLYHRERRKEIEILPRIMKGPFSRAPPYGADNGSESCVRDKGRNEDRHEAVGLRESHALRICQRYLPRSCDLIEYAAERIAILEVDSSEESLDLSACEEIRVLKQRLSILYRDRERISIIAVSNLHGICGCGRIESVDRVDDIGYESRAESAPRSGYCTVPRRRIAGSTAQAAAVSFRRGVTNWAESRPVLNLRAGR